MVRVRVGLGLGLTVDIQIETICQLQRSGRPTSPPPFVYTTHTDLSTCRPVDLST